MTDLTSNIEKHVRSILAEEWDAGGQISSRNDGAFAEEVACVLGMVLADARVLEVQRYLRLAERRRLGTSLHSASQRHRIAELLCRVGQTP